MSALPTGKQYEAFVENKVAKAAVCGFEVDPAEINPALKDVTRAIARWAVGGGRRAAFASFGLHKTATQLEYLRLIGTRHPGIRLNVLPLGVRPEFFSDAERYFKGDHAINLKFIRRAGEIEDDRTIYLTNYESVREGILDIAAIKPVAVSLDEAAILRGFGGTKTFRELMAVLAGDDRRNNTRTASYEIPFRLVATAMPSPNEYIELLAYSAFLGVMDVGQAKTRFFQRNSEKADDLTIRPHKEREFWLWVASWALFVLKPSDLGFSDDGYELPALRVHWHEIPSDHSTAGAEKDGQGRMFKNAALGVTDASKEKRSSLPARVAKVAEIVSAGDGSQWVLWCDLNDEQTAIEEAVGVSCSSLTGTQSVDEREARMAKWKARETVAFLSKPSMYGAGVNMQQAHQMAFAGIGFKFHEFFQALHREVRFGQLHEVDAHIIYTEAEREVRRELERKWAQHVKTLETMTEIIREFGLAQVSMAHALRRSIGCERQEEHGDAWTLVNNDCVVETRSMASDSVGLIVSSIPFAFQYEYSPNYNDFGHTDSNEHFWQQMDFLTPELFRVLGPGRVCAIHVKDRITPGGINGFGFQTVEPISDDCIRHFRKHGFALLGRITVTTDVVKENKQTNRLGWTEQCKDGSRMGNGLPEYILLFRKPQTDRERGYADIPVVKDKAVFTRPRWQFDAHGYWRSSGNRLLQPEDLQKLERHQIFKAFRKYSLENVYDHERDVALAEAVNVSGWLPKTFTLLQLASWHPDVWTDVARMRTLNAEQKRTGREMHLCPLQFDICDRLIRRFSMKGEVVYDPFAGIGTVLARALKQGRRGLGCELNAGYWKDGIWYCRAEEAKLATPDLFALLEAEAEVESEPDAGDGLDVAAEAAA